MSVRAYQGLCSIPAEASRPEGSNDGAPIGRPRLALIATEAGPWIVNTSRADVRAPVASFGSTASGARAARVLTPGYLKLKNDGGAREIRVGAREFECIGEAPPHDHPHVHIDMGSQDTILCPYCGTRYRRDDTLAPEQADPVDSVFPDVELIPEPAEKDARAAPMEASEAARPRLCEALDGSTGPGTSLHSRRRTKMFGYQGGEDEATVSRKRGYLKDAQRKWPFLTNLDASTVKSEGQLVDLVKTRISLSQEQATRDVRAWMEGKQF